MYMLIEFGIKWAAMSDNVHSDTCAHRKFRSACTFTQFDRRLHWAYLFTIDAKKFHADNKH